VIATAASPEPLRIEGLAVSVWASLETARGIDEITDEIARDGAPTVGLDDDVARTLRDLVAAGLVVRA